METCGDKMAKNEKKWQLGCAISPSGTTPETTQKHLRPQ